MANQANIMNILQSNVADIRPFAHDNRFTVFFDSPSGAEYNSATKTTQEQYTRGRWKASTTGFMPWCATAVQALRNTSWSHLLHTLGGYRIRIPGRLHPVYGSNRRVRTGPR